MNQFPPDPGVIDIGDKLFTGVNKTGDKLSMVSLLPAIYYRQ
jgi:hypothetical protein